jgi:hypothetical protein
MHKDSKDTKKFHNELFDLEDKLTDFIHKRKDIEIKKAKSYSRVRRGKFEKVKGYTGRTAEGIKIDPSKLDEIVTHSPEFTREERIVGMHLIYREEQEWKKWATREQKSEGKKNRFAKVVADILTDNGKNMTAAIGLADDPDINLIAKNGRTFQIVGKAFHEMEAHQCHRNSSKLFMRKKVDSIGTGYALNRRGSWTQHSWGLKGGKIVETTYPNFMIYYGTVLKGNEAKAFAKSNGVV